MTQVKLIWIRGVDQIGYLARVSNPKATIADESEKLIAYLIRNRHWSPFEMASMCVEINTTRDIGRQILRHRSFSFQEFSQRYGEVGAPVAGREMRSKGGTTRQGSIDGTAQDFGPLPDEMFKLAQDCFVMYQYALSRGVAPECARAILPEGYTPTRMYMTGTIRSWIHYIKERTTPNVQKEHRLIAEAIKEILHTQAPLVYQAAFVLAE